MPPIRPRILAIVDVQGWILERHALTLRRLLADELDIQVAYARDPVREADWDLVYALEFNLVQDGVVSRPAKWVTGIRSHLSWQGLAPETVARYLRARFGAVHTVSERLFRTFAPLLPGLRNVPHGVDTAHFTARLPASGAAGRVRVGWAGDRTLPGKGFADLVEPLGHLPGVDLVYCGYRDLTLGLEEMPRFYQGVDVCVCASDQEGHNNVLLEAASMGRAMVTTDSGTVPEYLEHEVSALIVPREPAAFAQAVLRLRDDPGLRERLGRAARAAVRERFDWRARARGYAALFREVLGGKEVARAAAPDAEAVAPRPAASADPLRDIRELVSQRRLAEAARRVEAYAAMFPLDLALQRALGQFRERLGRMHP